MATKKTTKRLSGVVRAAKSKAAKVAKVPAKAKAAVKKVAKAVASTKASSKTAGNAPKRSSAKAATKQPSGPIAEGSHAPDFELSDDLGTVHSAASLAGKPYVLYFYPKDDTPGCTKEACDFRDSLTRFNGGRVRVLGVSPDSIASHGKFRKKYGLSFPLISDPDKVLAEAYGVWVKKLNYGREYMGIERSTFLVDAKGVVRKAWRRVRVPGHVDEVLEAAKAL